MLRSGCHFLADSRFQQSSDMEKFLGHADSSAVVWAAVEAAKPLPDPKN